MGEDVLHHGAEGGSALGPSWSNCFHPDPPVGAYHAPRVRHKVCTYSVGSHATLPDRSPPKMISYVTGTIGAFHFNRHTGYLGYTEAINQTLRLYADSGAAVRQGPR